MDGSRRVVWFLSRVDLVPPEQISELVKPRDRDFIREASCQAAARLLLVKQRTSDPDHQPPSQQKRHLFRTKKRKEAACNEANWIFTDYEVAMALDSLLSQETLASTGVAQALLSHKSAASLDELWRHLENPKLNRKSSIFRRHDGESGLPQPSMTWLSKVMNHRNIEYLQLLCQTAVSKLVLTQAFGTALSTYSIGAMRLLLAFGADASSYQKLIRAHIRNGNEILVELLLSAPNSMSTAAWLECLDWEDTTGAESMGNITPNIILMCVNNRRDIVCSDLLLKTLEAQDLHATAVVLAYATNPKNNFCEIRQRTCELTCRVKNNKSRLAFFTLLFASGLVEDDLVTREELVKDVKAPYPPLVNLLIKAGVSVDIPSHNALKWVVSQLEFKVLELFKSAVFSSPPSLALKYVPESASEEDLVELMNILGPAMASVDLGPHLVYAVQRRHLHLVKKLVHFKAPLEYEQGAAIRVALLLTDFDMLGALLQGDCSEMVLSIAVPDAMAIVARATRLRAMRALLKKGVIADCLAGPLQQLVLTCGDDADLELIQLLLEYQAPVDISDDADCNPVLVVARRGNLSALKMLCATAPRAKTLAAAVLIAFNAMDTVGYDVAMSMINLLLQKGAAGRPLNQTLLLTIVKDMRGDIVRTLVDHGADANYALGEPFSLAIQHANLKSLKILCVKCPPSLQNLGSLLVTAIDPKYYSLQILTLLVESVPSRIKAINASWSTGAERQLRCHPKLTEVIRCLFELGLNIDTSHGLLLRLVIQIKDVIFLGEMLTRDPARGSLAAAFREAGQIEPRNIKLEIFGLLLERSRASEIGQSEALLEETHIALAGDLLGLQLLLRHKAMVDFDDGKALQIAAAAGSLNVVNMLLAAGVTSQNVDKAFAAAAFSPINTICRDQMLKGLLATYSLQEDRDAVLSISLGTAIEREPNSTALPQLLLAYGVKIDVVLLQGAVVSASYELFTMLARAISNPFVANQTFKCAREKPIEAQRRYWIYKCLLDKGVTREQISLSLINWIKVDSQNIDIPKLLLEHSATPGHRNEAALVLATNSKKPMVLDLLSQYLVSGLDDEAANLTFDRVFRDANVGSDLRRKIYQSVLQCNIGQKSLDGALANAVGSYNADIAIVQLLLDHGADPNENRAQCFRLSCNHGTNLVFRAISKHANLREVLPTLLDCTTEERVAARWIRMCLEAQPNGGKIEQSELLFDCIRKFPGGSEILDLVLDHGVSPSAKIQYSLRENWRREPCTALIWCLASENNVKNKTILRLLARGNAALPKYSTPRTGISAVFLCLIDEARTPILEALFASNEWDVRKSIISGSTLRKLSAHPSESETDRGMKSIVLSKEYEVSLFDASLCLGNFGAFRLITCCGQQFPFAEVRRQYIRTQLERNTPHPLYCSNRDCAKFIPFTEYCEPVSARCDFCTHSTCLLCRNPLHVRGICVFRLEKLDSGDMVHEKFKKKFYADWHHPNKTGYFGSVYLDKKYYTYLKDGLPYGKHLQYHGTQRACYIGDNDHAPVLCNGKECHLCSILRDGFKLDYAHSRGPSPMFGRGIYSTSVCSKADNYVGNHNTQSYARVMLLCLVSSSKPELLYAADHKKTSPSNGYDSVEAVTQDQGGAVVYPEMVVYDEDAIIPIGLMIYTAINTD